jgi:lipoprotein-anchoring transpeptidase ErfK/SrfK
MINRIAITAAITVALMSTSAFAGQLKFAPETFQILGGTDGNNQVISMASLPRQKSSQSTNHTESQIVDFFEAMKPGSILVRTSERKLYFVLPDNKAIMYPVGVGREGFTWSGTNKISRKATWPDWRPPQEMIEREAEKGHFIPAFMPGGPENPLGARALYIGNTHFRIHGTTQPWSIGGAVSSGCIRMMNEQVIDLFNRAKVGATVIVE